MSDDLKSRSFTVAHATGEKRPVVFLEHAEAEIARLNSTIDFMGRKLALMIPKVRVDEQIQLDPIEIDQLVRWHTQMTEKCVAKQLYDRARFHRDRAIALKMVVIIEGDDNSAA